MTLSSANKQPILLFFGPTAVGKTKALFSLFADKAEIISADSQQVYRCLDVGAAKPAAEVLKRLPHHLIDFKEPGEGFKIGEFIERADKLAPEIAGRKRLPIVSGGTAFYFLGFIFGLSNAPATDPEVRKELKKRLAVRGLPALRAELAGVDPQSAERLSPNDSQRILRALEARRISGRTFSSFASPAVPRDLYDFLAIGLKRSPEDLRRRIDQRTEKMFASGLIEEIKDLIKEGCRETDPGLRGIGCREFFSFRRHGCQTLEGPDGLKRRIKLNTWRYAKRQMTFFRKIPNVKWFEADREKEIENTVAAWLRRVGG